MFVRVLFVRVCVLVCCLSVLCVSTQRKHIVYTRLMALPAFFIGCVRVFFLMSWQNILINRETRACADFAAVCRDKA